VSSRLDASGVLDGTARVEEDSMHARIESALQAAIAGMATGAPPLLASALRHAVFPGGARVRPQLCLAVAAACGDGEPGLADAAAAGIELLHCASLVHDDLPCFDDAATRRGLPTVHRLFGEPIAVLAGDALIVLAFDTLTRAGRAAPAAVRGRALDLHAILGHAAGSPEGLVAGQAWESEPEPPLEAYHQAKTGALFEAATMAGAVAAGADAEAWRPVGARLGAAYQVADDLLDALGDPDLAGKPTARDVALARPNAVIELGAKGAVRRLEQLVAEASAAIPPCAGAAALRRLVELQSDRLVPPTLARPRVAL
jgi:geranylgeranyl diphosphate synthase type II